jgi:hypothetical protein
MWSLENLGRESLHAILFQTLNLAGFSKFRSHRLQNSDRLVRLVVPHAKKPDSVWRISKTLDAVDRIIAIKNPDTVWRIPQTSSAKFATRLKRAAVARRKATSILALAHPPSLWLCHAQMWRVFPSVPQRAGGAS